MCNVSSIVLLLTLTRHNMVDMSRLIWTLYEDLITHIKLLSQYTILDSLIVAHRLGTQIIGSIWGSKPGKGQLLIQNKKELLM